MFVAPPAYIWAEQETETSAIASPSPSFGPRSAWETINLRMSELRWLSDGWDGDDAIAPASELIDSVSHLLMWQRTAGQPAPTRIIPSEDGSIIIEWRSPDCLQTLEVETPFVGSLWSQVTGQRSQFKTFRWLPSRATRTAECD